MDLKNQQHRHQIISIIGLMIFGTTGRYILVGMGLQPFPNFEVIMVVTFLAMILVRSPLALLVPLVSMVGSDLLLGNHIFIGNQMNRIVLFTYSGFAIIGVISFFNRNRLWKGLGQFRLKTIGLTAGLGVGFVLIYDIWTNIGWWYLMYPHDGASLAAVFSAGAPFMLYHMMSGIVTFIAIAFPIMMYAHKKQIGILLHPVTLKKIHTIPAVLLVLALVILSFTGTAMNVPQKTEVWLEKSDQTSVRIDVVGNGWTINDNLVAYPDDTAFSLLQRSSMKRGFALEFTYYEQFDAILIDSINNAASGTEGRYWQYYVNGELPTIGADKYFVSNGDSLRFSFEILTI